jgi:hypothetical protein
MSPEDKLKGVIRRVAQSRGHRLGPWRVHIEVRSQRLVGVPYATCKKCGMYIPGPGLDVRTIPQCGTLFSTGKEG